MHYFVTIVNNVTPGNAVNLLGMAITSDSFLVSQLVENASLFLGGQKISYSKGVVLVKLIKYRIKLYRYVSNLDQPFVVTESNFKDRHPLINDAFHNCQQ